MGISFCSCFAGGIFIGAALLDLLPEVEELFDKVKQQVGRGWGETAQFSVAIKKMF